MCVDHNSNHPHFHHGHEHHHEHEYHHDHEHDHPHEHHHHDHEHDHDHGGHKVSVQRDVLSGNQALAERNRGFFEAKDICCLNIVSSPGSGKTTILEETIKRLKDTVSIAVIEGDQHTTNDADRIAATGVPALQINTENGCHLDAAMVNHAAKELKLADHSLLFVENVGNLVCPAMFDLGEELRVVVVSVTEGDDKPLKYPYMFESAQVCLINKVDLAPYLKSDLAKLRQNATTVNHHLQFFELSAQTGQGMDEWCEFLKQQIKG